MESPLPVWAGYLFIVLGISCLAYIVYNLFQHSVNKKAQSIVDEYLDKEFEKYDEDYDPTDGDHLMCRWNPCRQCTRIMMRAYDIQLRQGAVLINNMHLLSKESK